MSKSLQTNDPSVLGAMQVSSGNQFFFYLSPPWPLLPHSFKMAAVTEGIQSSFLNKAKM
jgi:hypothetical protein